MARRSSRTGRGRGGFSRGRRRVYNGARRSTRARSGGRRRVSASRRSSHQTVRIVLEQPGPNPNTAAPMLRPGLMVDNSTPGRARF